MKIAAVSMFHDEEDVAEYVVRHMLDECDQVIVADNNSTDRSRVILEAIHNPRLTIVEEPRFAYGQPETMMRLVGMTNADWIIPFDFDEWWDAEGTIWEALESLDVEATGTTTWDMIPQDSDGTNRNPFRRIVHTRPGSLWSHPIHHKIAFRPASGRVLMPGNHGLEGRPLAPTGPLRIRHYPFRSFEQAKAKLRHGRAVNLAAGVTGLGEHWSEWGDYPDDALMEWWSLWTMSEGLEVWQSPS